MRNLDGWSGSDSAAPMRTWPACLRSAASLAKRPTESKDFASGVTPSELTDPRVVRRPKIPQHAAGARTPPSVSVPSARSQSPDATATAGPLEDPPGTRFGFAGLIGPLLRW